MMEYDPHAWFWIVAGDETCAWSSADGAYVSDYPVDRLTRIASESELSDVLRPYGIFGPVVTAHDFASAIQAHIDATAKARNYADGVSLASYSVSTIPQWAAEALAFVAWRDAVWAYAYTEMAKVQNGQRPQPSIETLIAELLTMEWPA